MTRAGGADDGGARDGATLSPFSTIDCLLRNQSGTTCGTKCGGLKHDKRLGAGCGSRHLTAPDAASSRRAVRPCGRLSKLWAVLLASTVWGCYAMSTLQEPHTLAAGRVRVGPQARITQGRMGEANVRPALDVQLRIGLREKLELQLLASTAGTGRLGIKALLVDWPSFMLAVVPSYQVQYMIEDSDNVADEDFLPEYVVQTAIVPVVIGIPVAAQLDLLFGVDVHAGRRRPLSWGAERSGPVLAFGAHVGIAVHGPRERSTFVPQCGMLVGALSASSRAPESYGSDYEFSTLRRGSLRWECALGVTFGARYESRAR